MGYVHLWEVGLCVFLVLTGGAFLMNGFTFVKITHNHYSEKHEDDEVKE